MNRLRVITLSLLVLALLAGGLPVTSTLAGWSRGAAVTRKKNGKYRRHTRAWWRRHRARQRVRRERAERRRQRAAAWRTAARGLNAPETAAPVSFRSAAIAPRPEPVRQTAAEPAPRPAAPPAHRAGLLPFESTLPHNWVSPRRAGAGATAFTVRGADGRAAGTAVVAPVGLPPEAAGAAPRAKSVGGVSLAALRRTVIDRMVEAGGWVTNDYVREVRGRRVFIVAAQTGAPGAPTQSLTFYFTEVDGRVYSLATTTPVELAEPVAAVAEQFVASIRPAGQRNLATQK